MNAGRTARRFAAAAHSGPFVLWYVTTSCFGASIVCFPTLRYLQRGWPLSSAACLQASYVSGPQGEGTALCAFAAGPCPPQWLFASVRSFNKDRAKFQSLCTSTRMVSSTLSLRARLVPSSTPDTVGASCSLHPRGIFPSAISACVMSGWYYAAGSNLIFLRAGFKRRVSTFPAAARAHDDDEQTGELRTTDEDELLATDYTNQEAYTDIKNQIEEFITSDVRQAVLGVEEDFEDGDEPVMRRKRTRTNGARGQKETERAAEDDADSQDMSGKDIINLQKLLRQCTRRVRTGGAGAVPSAIQSLSSGLTSLEEVGETSSSDYDMVITFSLRSWTQHGDLRKGLVAAFDLVAAALSYGHPPSVRTFNTIFEGLLSAGNPEIPHPSSAYTEAMRRSVEGDPRQKGKGGARGASKRYVKALEALGAVCAGGNSQQSAFKNVLYEMTVALTVENFWQRVPCREVCVFLS